MAIRLIFASASSKARFFAFKLARSALSWPDRDAMAGNTVHFTEPVVALGKLFVVDHNANVWAFGLK